MSQALLFAIGTGVFAITVVATLWYGYFTFRRLYTASVDAGPSHLPPTHAPRLGDIEPEHVPVAIA